MSRYVVVHHAHHPDEGVYRLVYATAREHLEPTLVENPEHDPDDLESQPQMVADLPVTVLHDPCDIVFAADDERWLGRDRDDIAREQRQIVRDALSVREEWQRAAQERGTHEPLPGVGETL